VRVVTVSIVSLVMRLHIITRLVRRLKLANVEYPTSVRRSQVANVMLVREIRLLRACNPLSVISKQFVKLSQVSEVRLARCCNPSVTCPHCDKSRLVSAVRLANSCNPSFPTYKSRLVRAVNPTNVCNASSGYSWVNVIVLRLGNLVQNLACPSKELPFIRNVVTVISNASRHTGLINRMYNAIVLSNGIICRTRSASSDDSMSIVLFAYVIKLKCKPDSCSSFFINESYTLNSEHWDWTEFHTVLDKISVV
jgi:hypothetical protein